MNQPYATLTLASALREVFGVQLYKNNERALLRRIFEYPEFRLAAACAWCTRSV